MMKGKNIFFRRALCLILGAAALLALTACSGAGEAASEISEPYAEEIVSTAPAETETPAPSATPAATETPAAQETGATKLYVQVGGSTFTATLEDNEAADAFAAMLEAGPVVISMQDYSGFEKVGSLGASLPASDSQTTTQAGDIVLYNSSQIVIFYGSNSWSYTRLARIDDLTGWAEALGDGDVTVTFSIGE